MSATEGDFIRLDWTDEEIESFLRQTADDAPAPTQALIELMRGNVRSLDEIEADIERGSDEKLT